MDEFFGKIDTLENIYDIIYPSVSIENPQFEFEFESHGWLVSVLNLEGRWVWVLG